MSEFVPLLMNLAFCLFTVQSQPVVPPQPTKPVIELPTSDVPPAPPPKPADPQPNVPFSLPADVLYVAQSDVPFLVASSPAAGVKITHETGPIKIRGKFSSSQQNISTRTFDKKYVVVVEPVETMKCELLIWPVGADKEELIVRQMLDINVLPIPPPTPPTPPNPPPQPPPTPSTVNPFGDEANRVLIIVEEADASKLPSAQAMILTSTTVRDYLNAHTSQGPKNKEWRIWDKDVDLKNERDVWKRGMGRTRSALPWIIIGAGKNGYEGPLPVNPQDALTLLQKYFGA